MGNRFPFPFPYRTAACFKHRASVLTTRHAPMSSVLGTVLLLAAGTSQAQDQSQGAPTGSLPAVTVEASSETPTSPVRGYTAKRSATATKTDTPLLETPQSISVIGRQEMQDRGALSVLEALRYVPGVASQVYGEDTRGQDDWINLRGFSGYGTSLYQDGLRMNTDASAFASQRSEPYGLERVEVLRGPSSALYGKGDAGGIVNRVSKRPRVDALREVEVQVGSFNRRQVAVDIGGRADDQGTLLYRLIGLGMGTETQDRYANGNPGSNTRVYLAPSVTWTPTRDTSLTILSELLRDRNDGFSFAYSPPGASMRKAASLLVGEPSFTGFDHDQSSIGYLFEHRLNNAWTLRQNARRSEVTVIYRRITARDLAGDGRTLERRVRVFDERNKQFAIDTQLEGKVAMGSIEHKLLFGLDVERQKTSNLTFSGSTGTLDIVNPVYGQAVTVSPSPDLDISGQHLRQLGLYAQNQMRLTPHWLVSLGGRMDWTAQKSLDHLADLMTEQKNNKFTGRIGINYLTKTGWAPYFSYAESFLPTLGRDVDGKDFKPTQGKQYEVGIKFSPDDGRSLYSVALFDLRKSNVLTVDTANLDYQVQKGMVRSRGLEVEAKTALVRGLHLSANYTYNDVKIIKSEDIDLGHIPTATPTQTASGWLNYTVQTGDWRGLGFGAGLRYVGPTYNDAANTWKNSSATLVDAAIHYESGSWRFALNIRNLANREQIAACFESAGAGSQCTYGQERTAVLSAVYRF